MGIAPDGTTGRYRGPVPWILGAEPVQVELVQPWWQDVLLPILALVVSLGSVLLTLVLRWWDGVRLVIETDRDGQGVLVRNVGRSSTAMIHQVFMAQRRTPGHGPRAGGEAPLRTPGVTLPVKLGPGEEQHFRSAPAKDPGQYNVTDFIKDRQVRGGVRHGHGEARGKWVGVIKLRRVDEEGRPDPSS